jgi:hypothetical protein
MRRQIVILFLGLLMTCGTVLAGYPDEYFGPPLPDGCIEVEAYVPEGWYLDRYPWSSVSPEENIFWFGELCVEGNIAVLEFTQFGGRVCREQPWGTREEMPLCWVWSLYDITDPDRHVMPWDPAFDVDWGFYLAAVSIGDWDWAYDSLTARTDGSMVFVEGVFHFDPPFWWVESDEFSRWKFLVKPRTAKSLILFRRTNERRGQ